MTGHFATPSHKAAPNQQVAAVQVDSQHEDREQTSWVYCVHNNVYCCTRSMAQVVALMLNADSEASVLTNVFPSHWCLLLTELGYDYELPEESNFLNKNVTCDSCFTHLLCAVKYVVVVHRT